MNTRRICPGRAAVAGLAVLLLAGCARVTPHLSLPDLRLGEPSFFPTVEAYTTAPILAGNRVEFLLNGEEIFPALIEAIQSARKTITYAQYFYEDGPVSRDIAVALSDRSLAGVGVNVLLDAFGALGIPGEYVDMMRRAGCHVEFFRPLGPLAWHRANNRNHRRILVVDGRLGWTGGSGVSRKWMGNGRIEDHWRDTDVRVQGPIVEYLQGAFADNWLEATGIVLGGDAYFPRPLAPAGTVHAQVVRSSPAGGSAAMYTAFLLAMSSARRSIYITNPYLVLDDRMADALLSAVKRGVKVVVLTPGAIDHNLVRQASRGKWGRMLRERRAEPGRLRRADGPAPRGHHQAGPHLLAPGRLPSLARAGIRRSLHGAAGESVPRPALGGGEPSSPPPGRLQRPPGDDQAIEGEHDHGADDGHDEAGRLTLAIEAHHPPDPSPEQRTDDAENDGDDDAARIRPRHDELGHDTDDEAEHDPQQDVHRALLSGQSQPHCKEWAAHPVPKARGCKTYSSPRCCQASSTRVTPKAVSPTRGTVRTPGRKASSNGSVIAARNAVTPRILDTTRKAIHPVMRMRDSSSGEL